jgi:hypothetical protein
MSAVFLFCTVVGSAFVVLSNLIGHFSGGDGHGGHGGHAGHGHGGHAGHDGHHGHVSDLPLFSPTALAAYVTGFGACGLALGHFGVVNPLLTVPVSLAFGAAFGTGLLWSLARLASSAEGNSLASHDEVVGQDVEVSIAIPESGLGEVAFVAGGTRQALPARAEAGQSFPQGARVRVVRAVEGTLHVTRGAALPAPAAQVGEPVQAPPAKERVR